MKSETGKTEKKNRWRARRYEIASDTSRSGYDDVSLDCSLYGKRNKKKIIICFNNVRESNEKHLPLCIAFGPPSTEPILLGCRARFLYAGIYIYIYVPPSPSCRVYTRRVHSCIRIRVVYAAKVHRRNRASTRAPISMTFTEPTGSLKSLDEIFGRRTAARRTRRLSQTFE